MTSDEQMKLHEEKIATKKAEEDAKNGEKLKGRRKRKRKQECRKRKRLQYVQKHGKLICKKEKYICEDRVALLFNSFCYYILLYNQQIINI